MKPEATNITSLTLIEKALDFISLTPDEEEWRFEQQADNLPRLIRLQQLQVLLTLFVPEVFAGSNDMASGLAGLLNGAFILERDEVRYQDLFATMDRAITASRYSPTKYSDWQLHELANNYERTFRFKKEISNVLTFNDGVMEMSYPYLYSFLLTKDILKQINLQEINRFLSLVIDPAGKTFTLETLIRDYNYPKENVTEIDFDNW